MDMSNIITIIVILAIAVFLGPRFLTRRDGGSSGLNPPGNSPGNDRGPFPTNPKPTKDAPKDKGGDMVDRVEDAADDQKRSL